MTMLATVTPSYSVSVDELLDYAAGSVRTLNPASARSWLAQAKLYSLDGGQKRRALAVEADILTLEGRHDRAVALRVTRCREAPSHLRPACLAGVCDALLRIGDVDGAHQVIQDAVREAWTALTPGARQLHQLRLIRLHYTRVLHAQGRRRSALRCLDGAGPLSAFLGFRYTLEAAEIMGDATLVDAACDGLPEEMWFETPVQNLIWRTLSRLGTTQERAPAPALAPLAPTEAWNRIPF